MATEKNANTKFLSKLTPEMVGGKPRTVRFILGNGVEVQACLDNYSQEMVEKLAIHGLSQKVGDSASGFSKDRDFHAAFGAMQGVEDNLRIGVWASKGGAGTSDLVAALADLQGASLEDAQAAVDRMTEEQLASVRKHPAVKKAIADIQAARAAELAKAAEPLGDLLKSVGL